MPQVPLIMSWAKQQVSRLIWKLRNRYRDTVVHMSSRKEENVIKLHQFLYPNKDYTPTATVTDISNTLNDMTNVYPNTTESGTSQNE